MAIKKQITFEGLSYNLDERDRVAADAALNTFTDAVNTLIGSGHIKSGSGDVGAGVSSGQMFVTGSGAAAAGGSADYLVLCLKK